MTVQIALMLRALKKNKAISSLLILQLAITFAILSNSLWLLEQRFAALRMSSGVAERGLLVVIPNAVSTFAGVSESAMLKALLVLKTRSDVATAGLVNQLPFSGRDRWTVEVSRDEAGLDGKRSASVYVADADGEKTLGLELVQGRDFFPGEYVSVPLMQTFQNAHSVIVTEQLAKKLFPEDSGLGKTIFIASHPMQIVGLLRHLARPSYVGEDASQNTVLLPVLPKSERGMILIARLRDGELVSRHNLVGQLGDAFGAVSEGQVRWEISDFGAIRAKHFASDSAAMIVLAVISTALIVVSGFGVSGLSSYWMQLRIRQVATRRALGATRSQIIQYYLLENALLCTGGCVVGIVCAFLISVYLALIFNSRLLPLWYLLADSTAILVLSQISTIGSIRRVASVPPALASRL